MTNTQRNIGQQQSFTALTSLHGQINVRVHNLLRDTAIDSRHTVCVQTDDIIIGDMSP